MLVSPVSSKSIYFTSNNITPEVTSDDALLMLQDPKSAVIFKKNERDTKKALSNDPITALGYKLYKTFRYITNASYSVDAQKKAEKEKFVAVA